MAASQTDGDLEELLEYLKASRGFDFSAYKRASLQRRIDKHLRSLNIDSYPLYMEYLEMHPNEFEQLFNSILINVTGFFRDPEVWEYLRSDMLPRHLARLDDDESIRVWSAGCASGEEAYTLAIVLAEILGTEAFLRRVKIYGTDVDDDALRTARQATYSLHDLEGVDDDLRDRYFEPADGRYSFAGNLRRSVIFGRLDILNDAPISRLELLSCRNTLMYFNSEAQARVVERFHFALNDGGLLLLGQAETLLSHSTIFEPVDRKLRLFTRLPSARARRLANVTGDGHGAGPPDVHWLGFAALPLPALLFGSDSRLVQATDLARRILDVSESDYGVLVQDLDISYRPVDLRTPIMHALMDRRTKHLTAVEVEIEGSKHLFDVEVVPLDAEKNGSGVAVVFHNRTQQRALEDRLQLSNLELEQAYQEVQSTNEELETTNEELQSTIEELETTNEELQSTNEELETMNEELHSTNDELHAVNEELRLRSDEVNQLNHFLQAIFASFRSGVVVVDSTRRILVWNPEAEEMWGVREDEVRNLDLLNVDIGLPLERLREPLEACLRGMTDYAELDFPALTRRGRSITCHVSIAPLRRAETITGAILMMESVPDPDAAQ